MVFNVALILLARYSINKLLSNVLDYERAIALKQ